MDDLLDGYRRFRATGFVHHEDRFRRLASAGQEPKAVVVSCCDSRVDPQMIFGADPGDLFVIRNVAAIVPPYEPDGHYHGTSAALEFGVRRLEVEHVIVLGHTQCGGIRALLGGGDAEESDFIGPWMAIADEVRACVCPHGHPITEEVRLAAELEGVRLSVANLLTFPWIRERVEAGRLGLHGCLFDFAAGDLLHLEPGTGRFRSVLETVEAA